MSRIYLPPISPRTRQNPLPPPPPGILAGRDGTDDPLLQPPSTHRPSFYCPTSVKHASRSSPSSGPGPGLTEQGPLFRAPAGRPTSPVFARRSSSTNLPTQPCTPDAQHGLGYHGLPSMGPLILPSLLIPRVQQLAKPGEPPTQQTRRHE